MNIYGIVSRFPMFLKFNFISRFEQFSAHIYIDFIDELLSVTNVIELNTFS